MIYVLYKSNDSEKRVKFESFEEALSFVKKNSAVKVFFHTANDVVNPSSVAKGLALANSQISISKILYNQIVSNVESDLLDSSLVRSGADILVAGYNCLQFDLKDLDETAVVPETDAPELSIQLSSFEFSFSTFQCLCRKNILTVADLAQSMKMDQNFFLGDDASTTEVMAFSATMQIACPLEKDGERINSTKNDNNDVHHSDQAKTSLNLFLSHPLDSIVWSPNIDKVFTSLSLNTFGQLLDYSMASLKREPYLTPADVTLIDECLAQWRDGVISSFGVENQGSEKIKKGAIETDEVPQGSSDDYRIDNYAWSARAQSVLSSLNIYKVSELFEKEDSDFLREPNMGRKTLQEINAFKKKFLVKPDVQEQTNAKKIVPVEEFPDWLKARRISNFEWSIRTKNVFGCLGIESVSDLLAYTDEELLRTRNFGQKSLREVREFKANLAGNSNFEEVRVTGTKHLTPKTSFERAGNKTIAEMISDEVGAGRNRGLMIIADRSGLMRRPLTLEQIGRRQRVTRERIRQIEEKAQQKLYSSNTAIQCLHREIEAEIVRAKTLPVEVVNLSQNIKSISDLNENLDFYTYLFDNLFDRFIFQINQNQMLTDFPKRAFEAGVSLFEKCIREELIGGSKSKIQEALERLFGSEKTLISAILLQTSSGFLWGKDDELLSYSKKVTAPVAVMEIMKDALEPMSNDEFIAEVKRRYPHLEARNVLNRCNHETGVYPFSQRTKGTIRHLQLPLDQQDILKNLIVEQLEQIGNEQFHSRDLLARLPDQFQRCLIDFTLSAFMRHHGFSNYLGRNMFGPEGEKRVLLADIIVDVLRRAGRRMHATEILEHVQDRRSVSPTYQILASPPIVHLGDNYFEYDPNAEGEFTEV